jgi:hypothetical protein
MLETKGWFLTWVSIETTKKKFKKLKNEQGIYFDMPL